jgi:hypothetical protein
MMKKSEQRADDRDPTADRDDDDLRPEYDFTAEQFRSAARGKYAGMIRIIPPEARLDH